VKTLALLVMLSPVVSTAAEIAVLATGARVRADKVERTGQGWILHSSGGRIEMAAESVVAVEAEPDAPAPEPAPAAPLPEDPRITDPRTLVTAAALRHGIHPALVHSVAAVESAYRPDAVSPKGALGVMQLMPSTAQALAANPNDLEQNIDAGTRLLRGLLEKYQSDPDPVRRALAAYNAGEGAVQRYQGVPPYRETRQYVDEVLKRYWKQVDPSVLASH
jgi:soluble lytic murein transglycosylase-like protein